MDESFNGQFPHQVAILIRPAVQDGHDGHNLSLQKFLSYRESIDVFVLFILHLT